MILILYTETTSPPKHNSLVEWYPLVVGGFKESINFSICERMVHSEGHNLEILHANL